MDHTGIFTFRFMAISGCRIPFATVGRQYTVTITLYERATGTIGTLHTIRVSSR